DDVAVFGVDRAGGGRAGEQGLGGGGEEVHGEVHAGVGAAFDGEVAGLGGAGADGDGVVVTAELCGVVGDADVGVADEGDAFLLHDLYPAKDYVFFVQFHVGDAIHEEAAGAVGAFEDGDGVAGGVELGGGGEAGGTGADDGDFFAGAGAGGVGDDPAFVPAALDDGILDVLDGDGRGVDAEDAGAFAGGGADAAGEVGEIVGFVQAVERLVPESAEDEIVELGDEVVDGAAGGHARDELAGVAEGDAAIHAARALVAEFFLLHVEVKL